MTRILQSIRNQDEGICQYARCAGPVPDSITIQLCPKHLERAYAAYLITHGDPLARNT